MFSKCNLCLTFRFSQIVIGLKKKPYDFLDQRNVVFDTDFAEFMQVVSELQVTIVLVL